MDWYRMLYEGKPQTEARCEKPRPQGIALFFHILLRQWWELIGLNILFFFSCLFLVTIPAALKAMSRVCIGMLREEGLSIPGGYWQSFRSGFLRTTAAGAIPAAVLGICGSSAVFYGKAMSENGLLAAPFVICLLVCAVLVMALMNLFPMLAFSDLPLGQLLKNALLLVLVRPGKHLLVLAVLLALAAVYLLCFPYSTVALAAIALSAFWLFACNVLWPVVQSHVFPEG